MAIRTSRGVADTNLDVTEKPESGGGQAEYLFVFVDTAGVEPTNNIAERVLRPAVLWRKGSFGTDFADGSRFAERILTTVATLKQQRRPLLDYLDQACRALGSGQDAPSLLPPSARN